jgi:hypothetical protein
VYDWIYALEDEFEPIRGLDDEDELRDSPPHLRGLHLRNGVPDGNGLLIQV